MRRIFLLIFIVGLISAIYTLRCTDIQKMESDIISSVPDIISPEQVSIQLQTEVPNKDMEQELPEYIQYYTEDDVVVMAKVLYREARGVHNVTQIACVAWVACNRVDAGRYGNTITDVLTRPYQFAWVEDTPIDDELVNIARDVLERWNLEKNTGDDYGRVLPSNYLYFHGDGRINWFRTKYEHTGEYWDYSLPSPYDNW